MLRIWQPPKWGELAGWIGVVGSVLLCVLGVCFENRKFCVWAEWY